MTALAAPGTPDDQLYLSISGPATFRISSHGGTSFGEVFLTCSGDFGRDTNGYVVDPAGRYLVGYALDAAGEPTDAETRIKIPSEAVSVAVGADGVVTSTDGSGTEARIAAVSLAGLPRPAELAAAEGGAFRATAGAGTPVTGTPGTNGLGTIASLRLEPAGVGLDRVLADTLSGRYGAAGARPLARAVADAYGGLAQLGRRGILA